MQVIEIPTKQITVSQLPAQKERRKRINKKSVKGLADSMKAVGQITPIIVKKAGKDYELIAGERRFMAAQVAGITTLSAVVEDAALSERQTEIQLIENAQRLDLHDFEFASQIEALIEQGKTTEQIATIAGVSTGKITRLRPLLNLNATQRMKAMAANIPATCLLPVARLGTRDLRNAAFDELLEWANDEHEPMTASDVSHWVQTEYHLQLRNAIFPIKSASLVESAGACTDCPKRTGNEQELFADIPGKHDQCVDAACFKSKTAAYAEMQVEKAKKKGWDVITDPDAIKKIFPYGFRGMIPRTQSLVRADDLPHFPDKKTYGQQFKNAPRVIVWDSESGDYCELLHRHDVEPEQPKAPEETTDDTTDERDGTAPDSPARRNAGDPVSGAAQVKAMRKERLARLDALTDKVGAAGGLTLDELQHVVATLYRSQMYENRKRLALQWEWAKNLKEATDASGEYEERISQVTDAEMLMIMLLEMSLIDQCYPTETIPTKSTDLDRLCAARGVKHTNPKKKSNA